jgi:hypothetical protein
MYPVGGEWRGDKEEHCERVRRAAFRLSPLTPLPSPPLRPKTYEHRRTRPFSFLEQKKYLHTYMSKRKRNAQGI